jgi:hypothetical protein
MEWISVEDELPLQMCDCIVYNSKGWMRNARAIYYPNDNIFVLYNPQEIDKFTLAVTHYIIIPEPPMDK